MRKYRHRETVLRDFRLKQIFADQEAKIDKEILYEDWVNRPRAIIEVLRRIPPDYYSQLKSIAASFIWFFEESTICVRGRVTRMPIDDVALKLLPDKLMYYILIIYLSCDLEDHYDGAIYTIAHELAHCWFCAFHLFKLSGEQEEKRAIELTLQWGFEQEREATIEYKREVCGGIESPVDKMP